MSKPTIQEALNLIREHFGLSLAEACELVKTPLHPRELRDEAAIAAMQGLVTRSGANSARDMVLIANNAYVVADAMLKAREG